MNVLSRVCSTIPRTVVIAALACTAARADLQGRLYMNEVAVADAMERVEIYNAGPDTVDLNLVIVRGTADYVITGQPPLPPGQYRAIDLIGGGYLDNLGGETSLADIVSGDDYDRVRYGQGGGAPLPHAGATVSLCRALDAAFAPPLFNEPGYSDAGNWTIAVLATFGGPNLAPPPQLGSTARINEVKPPAMLQDPTLPQPDLIELYNPTAVPIDVNGWFFTDGAGLAPIAGVIPPNDVLVLNVPLQVETTQLLYLFDDLGVRVDQMGLLHAPPLNRDECHARCPDGLGPADGFTWTTSGGGATLLVLPCTLGTRNCPINTVPVERSTWGRLRAIFRD